MSDLIINNVVKNFFKVSFLVLIVSLFLYIMMPFAISIILGGILAMALEPFVDFFKRKGLSTRTSLILFSLSLGIIGLVPVVAFLVRGSRKVSELMQSSQMSELSLNLTFSLHKFLDRVSELYDLDRTFLESKVTAFISFIVTFFSSLFSEFIAQLPVYLMLGFITLLSVYFFLKESDRIRSLFNRYFHFSGDHGDKFVHMCRVCCREVFFSNIMTGLIQASIVSIGALIFNIGDFFLVFFITFITSFIPVIGAAPVAALLALFCFMNDRFGAGIGMMIVSLVSGITDNIIRPFIGTLGEVEVHPLIGLLAVIGGVISFGLSGLFIGPLVASLIFGALPIIIDEYFPHI